MQHFTALPPLSLYIHIPWCVKKCPYCDFNSHELKNALPEKQYVNALLTDLDQQLADVWGRSIQTIFIGGGTPSLFSAEAINQLLSGLRARLNFPPSIEITLEANPGTVEQTRFDEFYAAEVNRISIGVQSFNNKHLQQLGRIHSAKEAIKAIEIAHRAGFKRINIDLMYGLPGQSVGEALGDLQCAFALNPDHISHYQLTIEPNTLFHHQPPLLPDDDHLADIEQACREQLAAHDYLRYEISAFARTDQACQHNLNYWQFGDYIGIGAGAHGKITHVDQTSHQQKIHRNWMVKNPREYLNATEQAQRLAGNKQLRDTETSFEFLLNAFRLVDGFETELFQLHCGLPISVIEKGLNLAEQKNLINWGLKEIQPTKLGLQYLNDLTEIFLPDENG